MKSDLVEPTGTCRVTVRASERSSFVEYHLIAATAGTQSPVAAAAEIFERLASTLLETGIQPMQEKLYGLARVRSEVLRRRDEIYRHHGLDRTMPITWVEGAPLLGCDFGGVQIWGIAPRDREPCVTTVEHPAAGKARLWTGRGFRMLHVPGLRGTMPSGALPAGGAAQAAQLFVNAATTLDSQRFSYAQVVRTWIYAARLLEWYGDLNRVRTAFYRQVGFDPANGRAFPASTGIMGRCDDEECLMDVLAVQIDRPGAVNVAPILRSPRQDSSFNYGSAFSRGVSLEIDGRRTVHVSGTASINSAGVSTYPGDAEHQSLETLMSIAAILEEQGGSLRDITSATLFCKNHEAWEAWERVARLLGLSEIPKICVRADVCRHDLLVEMEAVAVI